MEPSNTNIERDSYDGIQHTQQLHTPHPLLNRLKTSQLLLLLRQPPLLRKLPNLVEIPTHVRGARAICARYMFQTGRQGLALERGIAKAHDGMANVIEAMVVVPQEIVVEREVAVTDLHDKLVHEVGEVHQAVQLVEDGEREDLFARYVGEVHGRRELVRCGVCDF